MIRILLSRSVYATTSTRSVADSNLPLNGRLVEMKARRRTPLRIATSPRGGKHKLPGPVGGGVGILAIQCKGPHDTSDTIGQIPFMLPSHRTQVSLEPLLHCNRQHRPPVLPSLAPSDDNLVPVEVDVLDPKLETFLQTQPSSIDKRHDYPHRPLDVLQDRADFFPAEHNWDPVWHLGPGHLFNRAKARCQARDGTETTPRSVPAWTS